MGPRARIDLDALRHNLQQARQQAPNSRMIAVIKANAYGHGMLRAAQALHDADAFAVARVAEGVELRRSGIRKRILVLSGFLDAGELSQAVETRLDLSLHQSYQLALVEQNADALKLDYWLKLDTGMHRLGLPIEQLPDALDRLLARGVSAGQLRLMSHFACADDIDDDTTRYQIERFTFASHDLPYEKCLANSAGMLSWPLSRLHWCRPGIMLYGVSPMVGGRGEQHGLRPVMTLSSDLIAINHYEAGDAIGYGSTWRCPEPMPVGSIAIGYGDGYPRHAPHGTPVLLNGQRVPLVGRVSMDTINVDLRSQPDAQVGDLATLWGDGLPVEEIAELSGTIAYELFCGVTSRVQFEVSGG